MRNASELSEAKIADGFLSVVERFCDEDAKQPLDRVDLLAAEANLLGAQGCLGMKFTSTEFGLCAEGRYSSEHGYRQRPMSDILTVSQLRDAASKARERLLQLTT